jgi:glycosyltransferase A (GT-A) superfamily protein (DUF2064 family)
VRPLGFAVMAKAPIAGEAKTRLGRAIGHATAAAFYQALLLDTLAVVDEAVAVLTAEGPGPAEIGRWLVCPDERHAAALRALAPAGWSVYPQTGVGLMGGIFDACELGFAAGAHAVVVVDADSPAMAAARVLDCLTRLQTHDIVLGPTADGGYYLIGVTHAARARLAALLLEVRYDGATIAVETQRQAVRLGLRVDRGPISFDIDTAAELRRLAGDLGALPPAVLRFTRAALARLGTALEAAAEPTAVPAGSGTGE